MWLFTSRRTRVIIILPWYHWVRCYLGSGGPPKALSPWMRVASTGAKMVRMMWGSFEGCCCISSFKPLLLLILKCHESGSIQLHWLTSKLEGIRGASKLTSSLDKWENRGSHQECVSPVVTGIVRARTRPWNGWGSLEVWSRLVPQSSQLKEHIVVSGSAVDNTGIYSFFQQLL